ncbi:PP2C family serine/threonine-protein phosphatase [Arcicella sp. LKC2W]|uniref:PP2C family serine/threonine-protein phosphatase n=1 Tax=Arcicella sp. LKC2W TaxID=2984198 RepID=UPI002B1F6EFD|nr:PP2C family serine/threonine-protein phosphatase [Arcicella sp. LKC2W]MEA5457543.1 PP2C family serine/threonine-protein phosphatase [Arcicella sp. LKC2W]
MDTNSLENALNPNDSEATYRALRDSILQIYQFGTKIAKEANPDNELQVSWELGDTSLMNWISDTHCYLSRKGQKLQFLARPSKLEIISFSLDEGDKLLICSDSLRQNLSDNEIDEILQESNGSEVGCQNLLKIANVNALSGENTHNIVVMEVINHQKVITPTPIVDTKKSDKSSSKIKPIWFILPILLFAMGAGIYWLLQNNKVDFGKMLGFGKSNVVLEDTVNFINKDSIELAKANEVITKEFETEKTDVVTPEQKDDFTNAPVKEQKSDFETTKPSIIDNGSTSKNDLKSSSNKPSSKKTEASESSFSTKSSTNSTSFDPAKEEQNYNALLQQKEKWMTIKADLEGTLSSGNTAAAEKLKNSEKVLSRIEQKIRESAKKLGKN